MADPIDYDQLAPGIRETVRWLAGCGFDPCDSGDGVSNPEAGMECTDGEADSTEEGDD